MFGITTSENEIEATLHTHKWYIGNMDEGVHAGPFDTKAEALIWGGWAKSRRDVWGGRFVGSYTPIACDNEPSGHTVARGDFFTWQGYRVSL